MQIDFRRDDNSVISFTEVVEAPPVETGRKPVYPYQLAIIRQGEYWLIPKGRKDPQVQPAMDFPFGINKGHTIIYDKSWFDYARRIMTPEAYRWWAKPFMQVFNRHHMYDLCNPPNKDDDDVPRAENMIMPGNLLGLDKYEAGHWRIVCRDSLRAPSNLDPSKDNWHDRPTEWMQSTMVNNKGEVYLIGIGKYVFTPVVKQLAERWCAEMHIELFPPTPFTVEYEGKTETVTGYCVVDGTDIYGHAETRDIPLRAVVNRVATHPCVGWALESKPVIPID